MKTKRVLLMGVAAVALIVAASVMLAGGARSQGQASSIVEAVRQNTAQFKSLQAAKDAGYGLLHGCVSGQQEGAMGVHYANGAIVGDGEVDVAHPEALLYEPRRGDMQLVGVEFVVLADDWNAKHQAPPVLMGQLFNYVSSPNRYGLPNFYELHVWAWKRNPSGTFADWNPQVSCDDFTGDDSMHNGGGHN